MGGPPPGFLAGILDVRAMPDNLVPFLESRSDAFLFLPPVDVENSIKALLKDQAWLLPRPYKIYFASETRSPDLGFPVADSDPVRELRARTEIWINEEIALQIDGKRREQARKAFLAYIAQAIKLAENAMLSNLLADYHAVFWLVHSGHLASQFCSIPRRVNEAGKVTGDLVKYRTFATWATEMQRQMSGLAEKHQSILDGEEKRGLQFFNLLRENVLILTEEQIGRDMREIRSYVGGHLRKDPQVFRETIEALFLESNRLLSEDPPFAHAARLFGIDPSREIPFGFMFDPRFRRFVLDHPSARLHLTPDVTEFVDALTARIAQFGLLSKLRGGIRLMGPGKDGEVVSTDEPTSIAYSASTRPIDFGRPGVVDPMVHRFGLMYDLSGFSETLTGIARQGIKGEISSYRQMLLFQRKIESIADRHHLQFEKFLGDGAFFTTRRAIRLVHAATEIQRFYAHMRSRGFAFDKGIRIAINYGYYRLLPVQRTPNSTERVMEFYGPGVVELSRLTTGKTTKEIEELQTFLVNHGYDSRHVHSFFAPLTRDVDMTDRTMQSREFHAYVNENGHLINEGIVASMALIEALSQELPDENVRMVHLAIDSIDYVGFSCNLTGIDYIGVRPMGKVSLKGLTDVAVAEIIATSRGEVEVTACEEPRSLIEELRLTVQRLPGNRSTIVSREADTRETPLENEIAICVTDGTTDSLVMLGEYDPTSNELKRSISLEGSDLTRLLGIDTPITREGVEMKKHSLCSLYRKMSAHESTPTVPLSSFRQKRTFVAFLLGDRVERL